MKALGASIELTHKATARTQAAAWAQSLLDSAFVMRPPRPGVTRGRFDKQYRWQLTVQPWQPPRPGDGQGAGRKASAPDNGLRLYKLDLAVMWGASAHEHVAHFDTLRVARVRAGTAGATP